MSMRPCEPDISQVKAGVLATTPPDYPYRFGVIGRDEAEARRRFTAALARWAELHELIEEERRTGTIAS